MTTTAQRWTQIDWAPHVRERSVLGRRLRYLDYGEGQAVMLVHGLGGSWQTWLENIPALGEGRRVIAVDLPGFGGSEPLTRPVAMADYVETLATLIAELGLGRVLLVGHSMGGLIATRVALAHPDRVSGLALVNAGGIEIGRVRLALIVHFFIAFNAIFTRPGVSRAFARRPRLRRALVAGMLRDPGTMSPELSHELLPLMAAPGFVDAVRAAAAVAGDPGAERLAVPTLLIWGRHDRVLPLAAAESLARTLPGARLAIVDDAAHCPMLERPAEFNSLVIDLAGELQPAEQALAPL